MPAYASYKKLGQIFNLSETAARDLCLARVQSNWETFSAGRGSEDADK